MINNNLRIGIIGLGRWGINILNTVLRIKDINLICVCTRNKKVYKLLPENCEVFSNWETLIEQMNLDGLIICTPSETHFRIAKSSLQNGINILVEKPFTLDLNEAKELKEISEKRHLLVMTEYTQVFNPKFQKLLSSLNLVGNINSINTIAKNFGPVRKKTPVIWDWGCHELSTLITLIGSNPLESEAKKIEDKNNNHGDESTWELECKFKNNLITKSLVSNISEKKRQISILGQKGMLILDDNSKYPLQFYKNYESTEPPSFKGENILIENNKEPLQEALECFFKNIRTNEHNHWSLDLSLEITKILSNCLLKTTTRNI